MSLTSGVQVERASRVGDERLQRNRGDRWSSRPVLRTSSRTALADNVAN